MDNPPTRHRIDWIDVARGLALLAMAVYHFAWDLEFFGYADPGMTAQGGWRLFARSIATSFLFLVGFSLFLGHAGGIRWKPFLRRLAMVALAAAGITVATYMALPHGFIFFGILHQIAFASLAGLLFLRLPWPAVLAVAALVFAAPHFLRAPLFDPPWMWWVGLSSSDPHSNDYVPVFPWFAAALAGIAAAGMASHAGLLDRLSGFKPGRWSVPFRFAGRHSLAVYLLHQPLLIGLLWVFSQIHPSQVASPESGFIAACERQCAETRDGAFCPRYCGCVLDTLDADGRLGDVLEAGPDPDNDLYLREVAAACTAETDLLPGEETGQ